MNIVSLSAGCCLFAAGPLTEPVGVVHYLIVGAILFTAGWCAWRSNAMPSGC